MKNPRIFQYIGIALLTIATLGLEVGMTRIFSVTFWYNFVFMIISIALLGTGLSGVMLSFGKINKLSEKTTNGLLTLFSTLFAASIVFAFIHLNTINLQPENAFRDAAQWWNMVEYYAVLLLPFLFSGIVIGLIFSKYPAKINKFYFYDLIGASVGCLIILLMVPNLGGEATIFAIALIALAAAIFFSLNLKPWWTVALIAAAIIFFPHIKKASKYVNLIERVHNKRKIRGNIEYKTWNNFSYCVITGGQGRGWKGVNLDFACFTPIYKGHKGRIGNYYGSHKIPFQLLQRAGTRPVVALIGSGGGREVQAAQDYNALRTYAIEFNPTIVDVLKGRYAAYTGNLHDKTNVFLMEREGRSFIRNSHEQFDLIVQNNTLTQTASTAGAYALAEDYVITVDALKDYMGKLNKGGILYISQPQQLGVRMITIALEAFKQLGLTNAAQSICSMRSDPRFIAYTREFIMIKKGGYTKEEARWLKQNAAPNTLVLNYAPGMKRNTIHKQLIDAMNDSKKTKAIYDNSYTDIRPSTDNWPFFSQRAKFKNIGHLINELTRKGYARNRNIHTITASIQKWLNILKKRVSDTKAIVAIQENLKKIKTEIAKFRRFNKKDMTQYKTKNGTIIKKDTVMDSLDSKLNKLIDDISDLDDQPLKKREKMLNTTVEKMVSQLEKLEDYDNKNLAASAVKAITLADKSLTKNKGVARRLKNGIRRYQRQARIYTDRKSKNRSTFRVEQRLKKGYKNLIATATSPTLLAAIKKTANEARGLKEAFEIFTQWGYYDFKALTNRLPQSLGILVVNLAQALFFSIICIVLPLLFFKRSGLKDLKQKGRFFLYFMGLGFGFMLLEISLMQRFTLFLGHPIYAITTTLFVILIASSIGAFLSGKLQKFENPIRCMRFALISIILMTLFHITLVPGIFKLFLGSPMWLRIIVSFIVLIPLGIPMGMLFPSGIRWASKNAPDAVPWAWGVNGFASVIGSTLTVLIAMLWGFNAVILLALAVYAIGTLAFMTVEKGSILAR